MVVIVVTVLSGFRTAGWLIAPVPDKLNAFVIRERNNV
jgi:hypothetical protein